MTGVNHIGINAVSTALLSIEAGDGSTAASQFKIDAVIPEEGLIKIKDVRIYYRASLKTIPHLSFGEKLKVRLKQKIKFSERPYTDIDPAGIQLNQHAVLNCSHKYLLQPP